MTKSPTPNRRANLLLQILFITLSIPLTTTIQAAEPSATQALLNSPNNQIHLQFDLQVINGQSNVPMYSVSFSDQQLITDSPLGLDFTDTGPLTHNFQITGITRTSHDESYPVIAGKGSRARNHYNEIVFALREKSDPNRRIELIFRAYNDGVAFRYRFPEQPAFTDFVLRDELTRFTFTGNPKTYALPLNSYTTPYEKLYQLTPLSDLPADSLIGLPMLLEYPDNLYVALTEANLTDYAGLYVSPGDSSPSRSPSPSSSNSKTTFLSRLSPWPDQPDVKVKAAAPHLSPWRVLMIADNPGRLIESNLILNLNEPSRIDDTSWIHPGKISFPWWHGYVVEGQDFEGGLNTDTLKYYIDFCADAGIEYSSLDGFHGAWYGGPIGPTGPVDVTTAIPEIDLPGILRYAEEKGVRMRAWVHWKALEPQLDRAFAAYEEMGIEGVMVDFMDRDDQQMVRLYHDMVRKAAAHHLTVNFHGAYKPTGIRRTWPNLLTREAVLNLEYNKFDNTRCPPKHNVTVPFVRMLAGPLDYHQSGFRSVNADQFKNRYIAPFVIGTRSHYLAMNIVYENPLPMLSDHPAAYRGEPGFDFLTAIPTFWDETRYLSGAVGEYIAIARRRAGTWYLGAMTDQRRRITLPLDFLSKGPYTATLYADAPNQSPTTVNRQTTRVTAGDTLTLEMTEGGGYTARLTPASSR